ncbi:putative Carboxylic ester hydrolase [Seiridium cardinale]
MEVANTVPRSAYVYVFNEQNPWDGLCKGYASHILDVAFILQNYKDSLRDLQKASAIAFGEDIVKFTNGQSAVEAFRSRKERYCGISRRETRIVEPPASQRTGRSPSSFEGANGPGGTGVDRLMRIFTNFLSG